MIYLTIFLKQFLMRFVGASPDTGIQTKIRNEMMKKLKIIQFGIGML